MYGAGELFLGSSSLEMASWTLTGANLAFDGALAYDLGTKIYSGQQITNADIASIATSVVFAGRSSYLGSMIPAAKANPDWALINSIIQTTELIVNGIGAVAGDESE